MAYIANVPLFKSLQEHEQKILAAHLNSRRYDAGETVITEGEKSDTLYIIIEGRAKVVLKRQQAEEIVISELGPGDFFGEMALLDGKPRSADVICLTDSNMFCLEREDFNDVAKRNPSILQCLIIELCDRLRRANDMIKGVNISQMYIY
jgi:CRP-like cAMP-binding protein